MIPLTRPDPRRPDPRGSMAGAATVADRLRFAVVREDPDVEHALCSGAGAGAVLVVASGGCTALTLALRSSGPALRVTAFDAAPRQLRHLEAKRDAVARGNVEALNVGDDSPEGLNQCGEFESLFRTLRRFVEELVAPPEAIARYFDPVTSGVERTALVDAWTAHRYWPVAFSLALHDDLLQAMFGAAATQHAVPGSYPGYFRRAFEGALRSEAGPQNPFLAHVLLGRYLAAHAPDYVRAGRRADVELVEGQLPDVPHLERFDVVSLSNVFDWSDDALVAAWADVLGRHLRPGGTVLLRQLNNRRDVARFFADRFAFDHALGDDLLRRDRSFFYERILVATRRP